MMSGQVDTCIPGEPNLVVPTFPEGTASTSAIVGPHTSLEALRPERGEIYFGVLAQRKFRKNSSHQRTCGETHMRVDTD